MVEAVDPRTEASDICGFVSNRGGLFEWVCIEKPHAKIYRSRTGKLIYDNNPRADHHYFVNRYPNRKVQEPMDEVCTLCRKIGHSDSKCPSNPANWPQIPKGSK